MLNSHPSHSSHPSHPSHPHRLLETAVEDMRVDVVDRRCGVEEQEVDSLLHAVSTVTKAVNEMQSTYIIKAEETHLNQKIMTW